MSNAQFHIGSRAFMTRLRELAQQAKNSVYVQAMTFEGDAAGLELLDILAESKAEDVRLLVDSYSKVVINDRFVYSTAYLNNTSFRKEVRLTHKLLKEAQNRGIQVQFTNPVGLLMRRYPCRNHKKLVVIDGKTTFLGGINFSDHNFEWHDLMLELHDPDLAKLVAADFKATWKGNNQSDSFKLDNHQLYFFNGIKSRKVYSEFFDVLRNAKQEIVIISPYVSEPLLSILKNELKDEVQVKIVSPKENNKSLFKQHLNNEATKNYFHLYEYQNGMSHMKAILIDQETLILGSSNFDFASYYFEQEIVIATQDQTIIGNFKNEILGPALSASIKIETPRTKKMYSSLVKGITTFCKFASYTIWRPN